MLTQKIQNLNLEINFSSVFQRVEVVTVTKPQIKMILYYSYKNWQLVMKYFCCNISAAGVQNLNYPFKFFDDFKNLHRGTYLFCLM